MKKFTWYVVSNEVGGILAVYGSALGSEANAKAHEINNQTGARVALHYITGKRGKPVVGGAISMKGNIVWFGGAP